MVDKSVGQCNLMYMYDKPKSHQFINTIMYNYCIQGNIHLRFILPLLPLLSVGKFKTG